MLIKQLTDSLQNDINENLSIAIVCISICNMQNNDATVHRVVKT